MWCEEHSWSHDRSVPCQFCVQTLKSADAAEKEAEKVDENNRTREGCICNPYKGTHHKGVPEWCSDRTRSDSYIREALDELTLVLALKNSDYKIDGEFSNFEFAADVVGAGITVDAVMLTQIAIKLGRIKGQNTSEDFNFESYMDTIKDLAGYAVLFYAYTLKENSNG